MLMIWKKLGDFFVKYLNGKSNDLYHNKKTDFRSYFITFEAGARLEIMNKPDMVDAEKYLNRTGLIHIAFSVGSKERVDEITQLLKQMATILSADREQLVMVIMKVVWSP